MERPDFAEITQTSLQQELDSIPVTEDIERKSQRPTVLSRLSLARRIIWDTINPYSREMSDPIPGYPQRNRGIVRRWRARVGHFIHTFGLATAIASRDDPKYFAIMASAFVGMIYVDFIEKSKNKRDFFRRIHQIYPLFPKPAASITHQHVLNPE